MNFSATYTDSWKFIVYRQYLHKQKLLIIAGIEVDRG